MDLASLLQDGKHAAELVTNSLFLSPTALLQKGEHRDVDTSIVHVHVEWTHTDCTE